MRVFYFVFGLCITDILYILGTERTRRGGNGRTSDLDGKNQLVERKNPR
jgi:hypothetical protein